jgi:D-arabinitol dehydrogenase (NADP+)
LLLNIKKQKKDILKMKAVVINKPNDICVKDIEIPKLLTNEVLVKPIRGGICGTDVHIYEGDFIGTYPVVPCHEFSGEIVEVGEDVKYLKVGDKVIVDPNVKCGVCEPCRTGRINICENYSGVGVTRTGGFCEFVNVPERNVYKFENSSHEAAAFAEPLACVFYGQSRLNFTGEQSVIIWGAGAIGLLHLMTCLKVYGCSDITVVDLDEKKLAMAKEIGAKNVVIADENIEKKLSKINNGKFDVAIEATGNINALQTMFKCLKRGAQALLFAVYDQKDKLTISPFDVFINDWKIVGSFTYNHDFLAAVRALDSGLIKSEILIEQSITLDEVPQIIEKMAKGARMGKVQVTINN